MTAVSVESGRVVRAQQGTKAVGVNEDEKPAPFRDDICKHTVEAPLPTTKGDGHIGCRICLTSTAAPLPTPHLRIRAQLNQDVACHAKHLDDPCKAQTDEEMRHLRHVEGKPHVPETWRAVQGLAPPLRTVRSGLPQARRTQRLRSRERNRSKGSRHLTRGPRRNWGCKGRHVHCSMDCGCDSTAGTARGSNALDTSRARTINAGCWFNKSRSSAGALRGCEEASGRLWIDGVTPA
mmetsp:Transcript_73125/g.169578  ORF Transcript_73125/g.169578 Transcript_73125/m.169578 type:complete len:236 (-) Transcript_73125:250-957(-)